MSTPPIVLVTGATGLVGGRLLPALAREGWAVRALSRRPDAKVAGDGEVLSWDGRSVGREALEGARAIVHLAGEPIFGGRLTARRRERIRESRIESTRSIAQGLSELPESRRPAVFLCASAVGYYGSRGDEVLEESAAPGSGFLARVCVDWEAAATAAEAAGVRTVSLRIGVVLAREGGALAALRRPFALGLGGRLGDGRQWFPWIHIDDLVALVLAALNDPRYRGPINATAPEPVTNAALTRCLASALRRPALLPVPSPVLRLALGELSEELLGSRRVVPRAALDRGFAFSRSTLEDALRAELA